MRVERNAEKDGIEIPDESMRDRIPTTTITTIRGNLKSWYS
jgi:hypothetical protein